MRHDGYGIVGGAWIEEDVDVDVPQERKDRDDDQEETQPRQP